MLLLLGLAGGTLGGLLGIGGSVIILPGLTILLSRSQGPEYQHVYNAAAMMLTVFVTAPAAWTHYRRKTILREVVKYLIPASLIGIFLGVACSNLPIFRGDGAIWLRRLLGVFLLYVMGYYLYRIFTRWRLPDPDTAQLSRMGWVKPTAAVGLPMGYFGGLLGIGAGSFCVPLQQLVLKLPLPRAIANSAATIFVVAIFGATYKVLTLPMGMEGTQYAIKLAAVLVPTCIIGGLLGARLTYVAPRRLMRAIFCLLMLYAGVKLLLS